MNNNIYILMIYKNTYCEDIRCFNTKECAYKNAALHYKLNNKDYLYSEVNHLFQQEDYKEIIEYANDLYFIFGNGYSYAVYYKEILY